MLYTRQDTTRAVPAKDEAHGQPFPLLTDAQRGVLLHLDPDGGWDHMTHSWPRGEALRAIGQLERYLTPDGDWLIDSSSAYGSECWRLSDLGRAVAEALRRGNTPPPGEGDGGPDA